MTKNLQTFVSPGQGAQAKGMGGNLFEDFKKMTDKQNSRL